MAFCAPLGQCEQVQPTPQLGETWSAPVAGRVKVGGTPRWVVFFGSGYNNIGEPNVGRSLWALDAVTGALLGRWDIDDLAAGAKNPSTIANTLPSSPSAVDFDGDGFVDRIYFADLEGRLWRLDVKGSATQSGTPLLIDNWPVTKVFDAGQARHDDDTRQWAPIITRPALSVVDSGTGKVNVYFGTGGDDLAPPDSSYFFYSLRDSGEVVTRYPDQLDASKKEWRISAESGHKYWADPMIADGAVAYFASLPGSIESVNPCLSLEGSSKLYAIAVRDFTDKAGISHLAGQSIFAPKAYLDTFAKVRQMMVLRGEPQQPWAKPFSLVSVAASDVLFQEFTGDDAWDRPAVRRIPFAGINATRRLRVTNWREIPREKWAP
jgi:Tfp pilus tip-associated adhesin PilY1